MLCAIKYANLDELVDFFVNSGNGDDYFKAIDRGLTDYLKTLKTLEDEKGELFTEDDINAINKIELYFDHPKINKDEVFYKRVTEIFGKAMDILCREFQTFLKIKSSEDELVELARYRKTVGVTATHLRRLKNYTYAFLAKSTYDMLKTLNMSSEEFEKAVFTLNAKMAEKNAYYELQRQIEQQEDEIAQTKKEIFKLFFAWFGEKAQQKKQLKQTLCEQKAKLNQLKTTLAKMPPLK